MLEYLIRHKVKFEVSNKEIRFKAGDENGEVIY